MKKKASKQGKKRPVNTGPKSAVGQARGALYRKTLSRVKEAREAGFVLEAVTLLESVISDRLEARLDYLELECDGKSPYWSITAMANTLKRGSDDPDEAKAVYSRIPRWAKERNKALHGLAKLAKIEDSKWDEKYEAARQAAVEGDELFQDLKKWVAKLNRPPKSK